jgi:hypothetical protein
VHQLHLHCKKVGPIVIIGLSFARRVDPDFFLRDSTSSRYSRTIHRIGAKYAIFISADTITLHLKPALVSADPFPSTFTSRYPPYERLRPVDTQ